MNPVGFLLIALVVAVGGCLAVVALHRAPQRGDSAMREFEREMQALAPRSGEERSARPDGPSSGITIDGTTGPTTAESGSDSDPGSGSEPGSDSGVDDDRHPTHHPRPDTGRGES